MSKILIIIVLISYIVSAQNYDTIPANIEQLSQSEQVDIYQQVCWNLRSKNPSVALEAGNKALELTQKLRDKNSEAKTLNFLGVIYRNIALYKKSIKSFNLALNIGKEIGDSIQIAHAYNSIGGIHRIYGQFTTALAFVIKAHNIFLRMKNDEGKAYALINLALIKKGQKKYEEALLYLKEILEIRDRLGDRFGYAIAMNHVAELYFEKGDYDLTMQYYNRLMPLYKELGDKREVSILYSGIARLNEMDGNLIEAKQNRFKSLKIAREVSYKEGEVKELCRLSIINLKLGHYAEANENIELAKRLVKNNSFIPGVLLLRQAQFEYYKLLEKPQLSFEAYLQYHNLKDSLIIAEDSLKNSRLEEIYLASEQIKDAQLLKKEVELRETQENYFAVYIAISLTFIVLIIFAYTRKKKANQNLISINTTKDKFFDIIAHDLRNPFNTLMGYADMLQQSFDDFSDEEKYQAIQEMNKSTKKLYLLVENLLDWAKSQTNRVEYIPEKIHLIDTVNYVIELFQPAAKVKSIDIKSGVGSQIFVYSDENILRTIIRNLLNNAIKFTPVNGEILIDAVESAEFLKFSIRDNGVGIEDEVIKKILSSDGQISTVGTNSERGSGLGLTLVKNFVKIIGGTLQIISVPGSGSKFTFTVPLVK